MRPTQRQRMLLVHFDLSPIRKSPIVGDLKMVTCYVLFSLQAVFDADSGVTSQPASTGGTASSTTGEGNAANGVDFEPDAEAAMNSMTSIKKVTLLLEHSQVSRLHPY